ncbi:MAG: geranylgeranyl reductase family protein [Bacteroidia bacterium]|nr:geranylgeranyl reductase family protein [Bacteroidia bacterium]MDW8301425.1 geranylgeranyl reductase family protein [Bacteroidia bacterium]
MDEHERITIIGAGPAGATAALTLAKLGIPCTLFDKAIFPRDKICGDAISGKVLEVIRKIEPAWINELQAQPYALTTWGISFISPDGHRVDLPFQKQPQPDKPPGFVIRRKDFDNFLIEKIKKEPLIRFHEGTEVKIARYRPDSIMIETDGKEKLIYYTKVILGADGANSIIASRFGKYELDPKHHCAGVRAYFKNVQGIHSQNFIELHYLKSLLPGYFWIFPLTENTVNVGIGMRSDYISKYRVNLRQKVLDCIENEPELRKRFTHAKLEGKITGWNLPLGSKLRRLSGHRYLLLGDAGALIDPFTGEGIGNAMYSGYLAALTLRHCLDHKLDFSEEVLLGYDTAITQRLKAELEISTTLQRLVQYPWLFNWIVKKASRSKGLQETLVCMFEDVSMRNYFKSPLFYLKVLFNF